MASQDVGAALNQLIHEMSNSLSSNLLPALEEMKRKFDDEDQKVMDWSNDVLHAVDETEQHWKEFTASALQDLHQVDSNVQASTNIVEPNAHDLNTAFQQVDEHVSVLLAAYTEDTNTLVEHMGELVQHHGKMEEEIAHGLTEFSGNVNTALHTLQENAGHIADAYTHVGQAVAHGVEDVAGQIAHTGEALTSNVTNIITHHASAVADLVSHGEQQLVQHVGGAIGDIVGTSVGAVGEFMHMGEELGQAFDGGLGDVLGVVEHVAGVVDTIKPVIELAETLL